MPRKSEIQAEEVAVGSPLRRSSRINVTSNAPNSAKTVHSVTDILETKTRTRRASLSQENTDKDDKKENKPAPRVRRGSTTKEESESKPEPTKTRSRRSSIAEESKPEESKPVLRRRRSSATEELYEPETARPLRSRRSSVTDTLEEDTDKKNLKGKRASSKEGSPSEEHIKKPTRSRRSSITDRGEENVNDVEVEKEKKRPTRTRRASTDKLEDEPETKTSRLTPSKPKRRLSITENAVNLEPIEEQETETKADKSNLKGDSNDSPVKSDISESSRRSTRLTPVKSRRRLSITETAANLEPINEQEPEPKGRKSNSPKTELTVVLTPSLSKSEIPKQKMEPTVKKSAKSVKPRRRLLVIDNTPKPELIEQKQLENKSPGLQVTQGEEGTKVIHQISSTKNSTNPDLDLDLDEALTEDSNSSMDKEVNVLSLTPVKSKPVEVKMSLDLSVIEETSFAGEPPEDEKGDKKVSPKCSSNHCKKSVSPETPRKSPRLMKQAVKQPEEEGESEETHDDSNASNKLELEDRGTHKPSIEKNLVNVEVEEGTIVKVEIEEDKDALKSSGNDVAFDGTVNVDPKTEEEALVNEEEQEKRSRELEHQPIFDSSKQNAREIDPTPKSKEDHPDISIGSDGSFRFHLNVSLPTTNSQNGSQSDGIEEAEVNLSKGSNGSDKENIHENALEEPVEKNMHENIEENLSNNSVEKELHVEPSNITVDDKGQVEHIIVGRVSNVFRPRMKENSFVEPMDVDETILDCHEEDVPPAKSTPVAVRSVKKLTEEGAIVKSTSRHNNLRSDSADYEEDSEDENFKLRLSVSQSNQDKQNSVKVNDEDEDSEFQEMSKNEVSKYQENIEIEDPQSNIIEAKDVKEEEKMVESPQMQRSSVTENLTDTETVILNPLFETKLDKIDMDKLPSPQNKQNKLNDLNLDGNILEEPEHPLDNPTSKSPNTSGTVQVKTCSKSPQNNVISGNEIHQEQRPFVSPVTGSEFSNLDDVFEDPKDPKSVLLKSAQKYEEGKGNNASPNHSENLVKSFSKSPQGKIAVTRNEISQEKSPYVSPAKGAEFSNLNYISEEPKDSKPIFFESPDKYEGGEGNTVSQNYSKGLDENLDPLEETQNSNKPRSQNSVPESSEEVRLAPNRDISAVDETEEILSEENQMSQESTLPSLPEEPKKMDMSDEYEFDIPSEEDVDKIEELGSKAGPKESELLMRSEVDTSSPLKRKAVNTEDQVIKKVKMSPNQLDISKESNIEKVQIEEIEGNVEDNGVEAENEETGSPKQLNLLEGSNIEEVQTEEVKENIEDNCVKAMDEEITSTDDLVKNGCSHTMEENFEKRDAEKQNVPSESGIRDFQENLDELEAKNVGTSMFSGNECSTFELNQESSENIAKIKDININKQMLEKDYEEMENDFKDVVQEYTSPKQKTKSRKSKHASMNDQEEEKDSYSDDLADQRKHSDKTESVDIVEQTMNTDNVERADTELDFVTSKKLDQHKIELMEESVVSKVDIIKSSDSHPEKLFKENKKRSKKKRKALREGDISSLDNIEDQKEDYGSSSNTSAEQIDLPEQPLETTDMVQSMDTVEGSVEGNKCTDKKKIKKKLKKRKTELMEKAEDSFDIKSNATSLEKMSLKESTPKKSKKKRDTVKATNSSSVEIEESVGHSSVEGKGEVEVVEETELQDKLNVKKSTEDERSKLSGQDNSSEEATTDHSEVDYEENDIECKSEETESTSMLSKELKKPKKSKKKQLKKKNKLEVETNGMKTFKLSVAEDAGEINKADSEEELSLQKEDHLEVKYGDGRNNIECKSGEAESTGMLKKQKKSKKKQFKNKNKMEVENDGIKTLELSVAKDAEEVGEANSYVDTEGTKSTKTDEKKLDVKSVSNTVGDALPKKRQIDLRGLERFANTKLDEYLSKKIAEIESDSESSPSVIFEEIEEEENEYICTMAEEGEEDTPSEGSNDIIDEGESINTTESEIGSDEDYDEDDSFICDDDVGTLLSGDEYDLGDEKKEKKKKSRIIKLDNFGDDDEIIQIPRKEKPVKKRKSRIIQISDSSDTDADKEENKEQLEVENVALTPPSSSQSNIPEDGSNIEEDDDDVMIVEDESSVESPQIGTLAPTPSLNEIEEPPRPNKRKSAITIHENINVSEIKDSALSERISNLVETFCTSVRRGEISMNLSLEYATKDSLEGSSQTVDKTSEETHEEDTKKPKGNDILSSISDDVFESEGRNQVTRKKSKKKRKSKSAHKVGIKTSRTSLSDSFEEDTSPRSERLSVTMDNIIESDDSKRASRKRRLSKSLENLNEGKKKNKKKTDKSWKKEMVSNNPRLIKKAKKRTSSADDLRTQTFSLMNQLITDVKRRPVRTILPSREVSDMSGSWITEIADVRPSTTIVSKREMTEFISSSKIHPKDFRSRMLYDPSRVKRVETKTLLKKRGAYF